MVAALEHAYGFHPRENVLEKRIDVNRNYLAAAFSQRELLT